MEEMKKWIALALCLVLALSLTACGEKKAGDTGDLLSQIKEKGEIVVAMIEDEATVKRFSRQNGHVWLLPENEAYSPIDGTYAQILGKVAAVVRRY